MNDHVHDLAAVREATDRLLAAVGELDNAALAEPSRLPGWTRGHILAHLSRNADAIVNVLSGRPMYASADARDSDIERGAPRPLDIQLTDLRDSAARFQDTAAAPADFNRVVELRNGVKDLASRIPFRRRVEIELHHIDLDIGYEPSDLPQDFVAAETAFLAERFREHPDVPALVLAPAGGEPLTSGRAPDGTGREITVAGPGAELMAWLAGRSDGARLDSGGAGLPVLPPL